MTEPANDFWPRPLRHCARPLVTGDDEEVIIGEITDEPVEGFSGSRMLYAALVPLKEVDLVLGTVGGIGHGVSCNTGRRGFNTGSAYVPPFTIDGPGSRHFESLVHTWLNHNKRVLLPDSALLMRYGLTPRTLQDGRIIWDDPDRLIYDVVRVTPLSTYSMQDGSTTARVTIRRDYLEDYLSLKDCAAIASFYEERFSTDDSEVASFIGKQGAHFEQPGRELWFIPMGLEDANQVSQVWACTLLLAPKGLPITDPPEAELTWPDRDLPIQGSGTRTSFDHFETAYVRDEVLMKYEKRDEFEISPESGFVSYDGRWSVSFCSRVGRNHIELELRKLYEGTPFDVIKHFNNFAVRAAVAEKDSEVYGTRHVGVRARDLIRAYLQLTTTLSQLSHKAGLAFTQEDIGQLSSVDISYSGWWTFENLKSLGHVAPLSLAPSDFLGRCKDVFRLLENLRPSSLLQILIRLGVNKESIAPFGGVKLLATICQLAKIATDGGLDLVSDCALVSATWKANVITQELRPLFGLNALRIADAHKLSESTPAKVAEALNVFGIDQAQCRTGWGGALDLVYDRTTSSLEEIDAGICGAST